MNKRKPGAGRPDGTTKYPHRVSTQLDDRTFNHYQSQAKRSQWVRLACENQMERDMTPTEATTPIPFISHSWSTYEVDLDDLTEHLLNEFQLPNTHSEKVSYVITEKLYCEERGGVLKIEVEIEQCPDAESLLAMIEEEWQNYFECN